MDWLAGLLSGSILVIGYAYVGYPALLWLATRRGTGPGWRTGSEGEELPGVTVVISAYNEEAVLERKLEETLAIDYPRGRLEVMVVSDGSTDATVDIARRFESRGVKLHHFEGRIGKTACLNRALPMATGDIIVFSDANSGYGKGVLKALVAPFGDATVGFVSGWTQYVAGDGDETLNALGLYARLELLTKALESRLGSCIGADGAIFAIRKRLYVPLQPYDINDFVIPLSINRQGYRGVLQAQAYCVEKDAGSTKGEFHRQVRITNRTIRAIVNYRDLLNPFRHGILAWQLFSHKVCKFLVPFLMMLAFGANLALVGEGTPFLLLFAAQCAFYGTALLSAGFLDRAGPLSSPVRAARTFVVVNLAIALAWVKYFRGETFTTWAPTKR